MMLADWWRLFRAEHSLITFVAILASELVSAGKLDVFAAIGPALITLGAFAWNDYFDFESDKALGRKDRPIVAGRISRKAAFFAGLILMILGAASTFFINENVFLIAFIFTLLAMAYNPLLKKLPLVGNTFIAFSMSVSFIYGNFVVSKNLNFFALAMAATAFLVGLGRELIITLRDVEGDKKIKARTLPMVIGEKNTVMLSSFLIYLGVAASLLPLTTKMSYAYAALIAVGDALLLYSTFIVASQRDFKNARKYTLYALGIGTLAFATLAFT